jgi:hypothetical protein
VSRLFGEIRQIAFVVEDIDRAMDYWSNVLGIGPFFIKRHLSLVDFTYRGKAQVSPVISIALANSGLVQVELIQQHDSVASIYKDFLDGGRRGLQHVSSWVTRDEFDIRKRELLGKGVTLAQEGTIAASGVRLAYFDTEQSGASLIFEMADLKEPGQYERVMAIAEAATAWNGERHVIEVGA